MIINPKFLFQKGYEGSMKWPNVQQVPKGTRFVITVVHESFSYFQYTVKFKGAEFEELNSEGPFIKHEEIEFGDNGELLYGRE